MNFFNSFLKYNLKTFFFFNFLNFKFISQLLAFCRQCIIIWVSWVDIKKIAFVVRKPSLIFVIKMKKNAIKSGEIEKKTAFKICRLKQTKKA